MAVKAFEQPRGSGEWWFLVNHQGFKWKKKLGKNKHLVHDLEARVKAAISRGSDDHGVQEVVIFALLDYDELSEHERRRRNFHLIPGGRTD